MDDTLNKIIFTLNQIEVRGAENLSRMLGCIQALQQLQKTDSVDAAKSGKFFDQGYANAIEKE